MDATNPNMIWLCQECESHFKHIEPAQGESRGNCDRCQQDRPIYRWYKLTAMDLLIRDGARLTMENERLAAELAARSAPPAPAEIAGE